MTKRHFKALAAIICQLEEECREFATKEIGELCAKENANFDWDKWNKACEPERDDA